jgi:hypothetical protein
LSTGCISPSAHRAAVQHPNDKNKATTRFAEERATIAGA